MADYIPDDEEDFYSPPVPPIAPINQIDFGYHGDPRKPKIKPKAKVAAPKSEPKKEKEEAPKFKKATVAEFAEAIRQQYPGQYDSIKDDYELAKAIVDVEPAFADAVDFGPVIPEGLDVSQYDMTPFADANPGLQMIEKGVEGFNKASDQGLGGPFGDMASSAAQGGRLLDDKVLGPLEDYLYRGTKDDQSLPMRTASRIGGDAISMLRDFVPKSPVEAALFPLNFHQPKGMYRVPSQPTAEASEYILKGLPTTAAEATGSKGLGKLESVLKNLDQGGPIDKMRFARGRELQREGAILIDKDATRQMAEATRDIERQKLTAEAYSLNEADDATKLFNRELAQKEAALAEERGMLQAGVQFEQQSMEKLGPLGKLDPLTSNANPRVAGMGLVRDLEVQADKAWKPVGVAYDKLETVGEKIGFVKAEATVPQLMNKIEDLNQALRTAPESAASTRLKGLLKNLVILDENGMVSQIKPVKANELVAARQDINFLLRNEGYRGTTLQGVKGGTTSVGGLLEEVRAALDEDIAAIGKGTKQGELFQKLNTNAKSEYQKFASTFKSKSVRALKTKDPEQVISFAVENGTKFADIEKAVGPEGVKKLAEHQHSKLFGELMKSDTAPTVLINHLDNMPAEVKKGLYSQEIINDFTKLAYGRDYAAYKKMENVAKMKEEIQTLKSAFEAGGKGRSQELAVKIGKLEAELESKIADIGAKREKELGALNQRLSKGGHRMGEDELSGAMLRGGDKNAGLGWKKAFDASAAVAVPASLIPGVGWKGVITALGITGARMTPNVAARLYMSPRGRELLIKAVETHGTPAGLQKVAELAALMKTRKMLGAKDEEK